VFIVIANDGWTSIYFNHFRQSEPISTSVYFITLITIGQFVLLNLMIAIIIENFEYHSVKSDLVGKLNNMQKEQESKELSFKEKLLSYLPCYEVSSKAGKDN
jgi:Ion transport protein